MLNYSNGYNTKNIINTINLDGDCDSDFMVVVYKIFFFSRVEKKIAKEKILLNGIKYVMCGCDEIIYTLV